MKKIVLILIALVGNITFSQEKQLAHIDEIVTTIDSDTTLSKTNFNWEILAGITTGQDGVRKIWFKGTNLHKVIEEIKFIDFISTTTIYFRNGKPIKIIEEEHNYKVKAERLKPFKVFSASIYVFDWEKDESKIIRSGKRVFTEGQCSNFDYESIIENAVKLIAE